MKRIIVIFMLLAVLTGCSAEKDSPDAADYSEKYAVSPYGNEEKLDTLPGLTLHADKERYDSASLEQIELTVENNSQKEYRYSDYYELEAEKDGVWYQLTQTGDGKEDSPEIRIPPGQKKRIIQDIGACYGEGLEPGHYRIIKSIAYFADEKDWDYKQYNVSSEFDIE
ncbi:membrane lipoprotein lipid attachment site-containing protein [Anaerovorax odorimutans]|uniref:Membrane lipoprotein lipid attachment site-containing protein n=1 Tax=Anaerovorax odorimutans TaxID=109327 RepID=A0ABT1RSP2_9FIRM|nr:membrane lipoprotein lipid attachment site-containing protein [Anaerovorax odorimutans]MCQ4638202.1 membrane lipoprotein lipid attachment site-containing protein [Anaerovorax odorimutans]